MEKDELKKILAELYIFEPSLRGRETEILELLSKMDELKPDTKFDASFAAKLKEMILSQTAEKFSASESASPIKIKFPYIFNYRSYAALGSLVVIVIVMLVVVDKWQLKNNQSDIKMVSRQAFGSLIEPGSQNEQANISQTDNSGGSIADNRFMVSGNMASPKIAAVGSAINQSQKYVYTGGAIELTEKTGRVYRRLRGDSGDAKKLAGLIEREAFSGLSLKSFSNLSATSFSVKEDKKFGLVINYDFIEGSINMAEDWDSWQGTDNQPVTAVPSDEEILSLANKFLVDHKISRKNYGEPIIDKSGVIYPLVVDGLSVYDQSGFPVGLRVTINLDKKIVSGLSGLSTYKYEASEYDLFDSPAELIKLAEQNDVQEMRGAGAINSGEQIINLNAPHRVLVQIWRYTDGRSNEFLVPALLFPVVSGDVTSLKYPRVIPLVKSLYK